MSDEEKNVTGAPPAVITISAVTGTPPPVIGIAALTEASAAGDGLPEHVLDTAALTSGADMAVTGTPPPVIEDATPICTLPAGTRLQLVESANPLERRFLATHPEHPSVLIIIKSDGTYEVTAAEIP